MIRLKKSNDSPSRIPQLPRGAKYAWGLLVSGLVLSSLALDKGSPYLPVLNQIIDALQQQPAPTPNR
jgi:hypothetical protein